MIGRVTACRHLSFFGKPVLDVRRVVGPEAGTRLTPTQQTAFEQIEQAVTTDEPFTHDTAIDWSVPATSSTPRPKRSSNNCC